MNKYKIICTARYGKNLMKLLSTIRKRAVKETMQRTFYYKAKNKKQALEKLYKYQDIKIEKKDDNTFYWEKIKVIKE